MEAHRAVQAEPLALTAGGLGVLAGTCWALLATELVPEPVLQMALAASLGLALVPLSLRWCPKAGGGSPHWARVPFNILASALCGALLAWALTMGRTTDRLTDRLALALEGQDLWATVEIQEMPTLRPDSVRLRVAPIGWPKTATAPGRESVVPPLQSAQLPRRLQVAWYTSTQTGQPPTFEAGQIWHLPLRLKRPHGNLNPHGFDTELWLLELGVGATGAVRAGASAQAELLAPARGFWIERGRQRVRDAIFERLGRTASAGVLAALAVGDQASIDRDDWAVFRRTGVAHLVAISGVHVTMFAWLAGAAADWAWRASPPLMLRCPAGRVARWVGVLAATLYALLSGWGVPAQRTVWMLMVWAVVSELGLRWPWPRTLLAAAVLVLLVDPWALLQAGFWLSFCAVGLLMLQGDDAVDSASLGEPPSQAAHWTAWLRRHAGRTLRLQLLTSVGLAPLSLLFFQQISLVGLLANLVAIPWVTLVITPLALLGLVVPALWSLGGATVGLLISLLQALSSVPGADWQAAAAPPWLLALGLLGGVLAILPIPPAWRWQGVPLILAMALPAGVRPEAGQFDVWAPDIGQGNAVLILTRRHALLFDAGPKFWHEGDAGERTLVPMLRSLGVSALDVLVLSHRDADHVGGASSVMKEFPPRLVMSSLEDGHLLRGTAPHQPCAAGMSWTWDGVRFDVLHPSAEVLARSADPVLAHAGVRPNAVSCVLSVVAGGRRILLTGDIERLQEWWLVESQGVALKADVLMVPHHGSKTSSSTAFIDAVRPSHGLIQAGYLNRYGHPAAEVVQRYDQRGIALVRSDRCGAWRWRSDSGLAECERNRSRRLWRDTEPRRPP